MDLTTPHRKLNWNDGKWNLVNCNSEVMQVLFHHSPQNKYILVELKTNDIHITLIFVNFNYCF